MKVNLRAAPFLLGCSMSVVFSSFLVPPVYAKEQGAVLYRNNNVFNPAGAHDHADARVHGAPARRQFHRHPRGQLGDRNDRNSPEASHDLFLLIKKATSKKIRP